MNKLKAYFTTFEGLAKSTIQVVVGGSATALAAKFTDPSSFNFSSANGWKDMRNAAIGGGLIAVFHVFVPSPKPPTPSNEVK